MSPDSREDFVERCMVDPDTVSAHPDNAERFAVCNAKWDEQRAVKFIFQKVNEERRIAYGWFSVIEENGEPVIDVQGDVIKAETLLDAAHDYVQDSRAGRIMHKGRRVADIVESIVLTSDVQKALGVELPNKRVGWFGAMKFRDDETWKRVKSGELRAFSIGGVGQRGIMEG